MPKQQRGTPSPVLLFALGAAAIMLVGGCGEGDTTTIINQTTTVETDTAAEGETPAAPEPSTQEGPTNASGGDCGDVAKGGFGVYNVEASLLSCEDAEAVARDWAKACVGESGECTVAGTFACTSKAPGNETAEVTCGDGEVEIRFVLAGFDPPS